jgi:hypothetical protein
MMAAASDPERGGALLDRFDLWIGLVQEALERAAAQCPIAAVVPPREAAYAICSMFLGIELMSRRTSAPGRGGLRHDADRRRSRGTVRADDARSRRGTP